VTEAHDQSETLHILAHVPEHEPRESDPHYHLFDAAKRRIKAQGLWKCALNDDLCGGQLELHHSHVEFSQVGGVDPAKLEQALGLHFTDGEEFQAWIESPGNLEVLCLPGDEPVLMADGSLRAIEDVSVGDQVLGHDAQSHTVGSVAISEFSGSVVAIDGRRMTGNHPVLTERGWVPAASVRSGDVACFMAPTDARGVSGELGMLDADVLGVGGIQAQVLGSIVIPDSVDVMNRLGSHQGAPDHAFHRKSMLHDEASASGGPVDDAHVAGRLPVAEAAASLPVLSFVEALDPAGVGAVLPQSRIKLPGPGDELGVAGQAPRYGSAASALLAAERTARAATCRIPFGDLRRHTIVLPADGALLNDCGQPAPFERRWRPIQHVDLLPFQGQVYDIEVLGSHSFVASDLVVHNCVNHHRTHYGVHVIPSALWETLRWHRAGQPAAAEFVAAKDLPK
jgi:hypothetical protein